MKGISSALATHIAGEVTTLATCWRVTRKDGAEFYFTDHDRDLTFEGNVYKASTGYSRTAIANEAGLAVHNLDVDGLFDSETITEQGLRAGLFDHAEVRVFLVNWADLTMGALKMRRGWFGEVVLTEQGTFPPSCAAWRRRCSSGWAKSTAPSAAPIWAIIVARSTWPYGPVPAA